MKSRPLSFQPDIDDIIRKCTFCSLAMVDAEGKPYVLPMNFGYSDKVIYLHSAPEGKKIDILKQHPDVCVGFSADLELRYRDVDVACSYSMKYKSVLVYGKVEFIADLKEKAAALDVIMRQYTSESFTYNAPALNNVCVYKVVGELFEGRVYGY
ncbi:MAG: pyridoxamine 5'-phosphate oxidase family protein [Bacteroidetes bacterium]|nr:pyridoxamine 5'-phosphate oxidase family protein [Bacteroidota bacterium]